jgi:TPR repeat protein
MGELQAADRGLKDAQYDLAICFITGQGMRKNEDKGLEYMKKAADQDLPGDSL